MRTKLRALGRLLFSPRGTIPWTTYLFATLTIFAFKYPLDVWFASHAGESLPFERYWQSSLFDGLQFAVGWAMRSPYGFLEAPLIWSGLVLAAKRVRSIGWPSPVVALFFVPIVNVVLLATVCVVCPEAKDEPIENEEDDWTRKRRLERSTLRVIVSALVAAFVGSLASIAIVYGSTRIATNYSYMLFLGGPFFTALFATVIYGSISPARFAEYFGVSIVAGVFSMFSLLFTGLEGLGCLLMAFPALIIPLFFGTMVGSLILQSRRISIPTWSFFALIVLAPALMGAESTKPDTYPVMAVSTSVIVNATPNNVWERVIDFPDLEPPTEFFFRNGIAYPIRARLEGRGVGAIRHCEFSTGAFVEPITKWEPGKELAFDVIENPPPMKEWSPYGEIDAAHLHGTFESQRGRFLLEALPGGKTKLTGTTWYVQRMDPQAYWNWWSDAIVHQIHFRVLEHVRKLAEADATSAAL